MPLLPGVTVAYLDAAAQHADPSRFVGTAPRSADLAALFHTGGTTGAPKLAAHTHAMEVADAWMLAAYAGFTPDSTVFAALPLFHVNALVVTLLMPLFKGQEVVWAGPLGYRDPGLYARFWTAGAALPHRLDERRAHRVRRADPAPGGRRHLQPAPARRRRVPAAQPRSATASGPTPASR